MRREAARSPVVPRIAVRRTLAMEISGPEYVERTG